MSPYDPVLRAQDIRRSSESIRGSVGKIEDGAVVAPIDISPEQMAAASLVLRRIANRHGCKCQDPAHAAGEWHQCSCSHRRHARDVVDARIVLEAAGLVGAREGRDERMNALGVRKQKDKNRHRRRKPQPGG